MFNAAIIDTDESNMTVMTDLLGRNRDISSVEVFSKASDYLEVLKEQHIDLAFIRVGNPGLQGLVLAKETKRISSDTRIVFMAENEQYAILAFEKEAWGYLLVPVNIKYLDQVITNIKSREECKKQQLLRENRNAITQCIYLNATNHSGI